MQVTVSAVPRSFAIRSSRSTRRRLRAVAAIITVLAVLGVSWAVLAASVFVTAMSGVTLDLGA